jgi:flagellar basal body rod protein FlgB
MSFFSNRLSSLMTKKQAWLSKRAEVLTYNVTHADMKNTYRQDLKPFKEFLGKNFEIKNKDITQSKHEIHAESEMLNITQNAMEHDATIQMVKAYHRMFKTATSKVQ